MITVKRLIAITSLTLLGTATQTAYAQLPNCQSAFSDSNGDGFGWENNASCRVVMFSSSSSLPTCSSASSDPDRDGFGYENGASCRVGVSSNSTTSSSAAGGTPTCASASSDPDGDGFGWENGASCQVGASSSTTSASSTSAGSPSCASANSDSDGDGFGWENGATCVVTASTGTGIISDDAASATSNGISDDAASATSNGVSNGGGTPAGGTNTNGGAFTADTGSGNFLRSSSLPVVGSNFVTTNSSGGDLFATEQVGDFTLMQNAWRAWRAAPGYDWSQTIYTNNNGTPVGWSYDWGPGVRGASGRASDDFYVRSYPELIYGIKDEFRTSAPKSQIGFPVRVDNLPTVSIDYAYNAPQFGASRTVDASVTSRFPNGNTIQGERNVAVESFLYESVNGMCDDNLPVNRSNGSNHAYEVMVWLDSGAERLPAAARDYVTTVTLRGAGYDVYTKSNDPRYIAFVARSPQTSGRIYWNDYVDWARQNAHRVQQLFGARSNSVQIQDSWCVANIIVGTEIFWGAGAFDLSQWTITQSQ